MCASDFVSGRDLCRKREKETEGRNVGTQVSRAMVCPSLRIKVIPCCIKVHAAECYACLSHCKGGARLGQSRHAHTRKHARSHTRAHAQAYTYTRTHVQLCTKNPQSERRIIISVPKKESFRHPNHEVVISPKSCNCRKFSTGSEHVLCRTQREAVLMQKTHAKR